MGPSSHLAFCVQQPVQKPGQVIEGEVLNAPAVGPLKHHTSSFPGQLSRRSALWQCAGELVSRWPWLLCPRWTQESTAVFHLLPTWLLEFGLF